MRRNLLVKRGGGSLGRVSLCQGAKSPGVFEYSIQECQEEDVYVGSKERGRNKGCLEDSLEGGSSGETQSDRDACFVTLSLQHLHEKKSYYFFWQLQGPCGYQDI